MSSELEADAHSESTLAGFLRRQHVKPKPLPTGTPLNGQVAIITGSNVGLGLEAARQLLGLGLSHLIMGVRTQSKGDAAAQGLRKEFPGATIDVWIVDMESYDSVRAFASRCEKLSRIDIVLLNAGLIKASHETQPATGHELTFQVNYLSTALLTILLLPILRAKKLTTAGARPPVLSVVNSDTAYMAKFETQGPVFRQFDDRPKSFDAFQNYARSKLMLALFVSKLAESVDRGDVLLQLVNPGMTGGTGLARENSWFVALVTRMIVAVIGRSVEVGATTYVDAVVAKGPESHGAFLSDWTIKPYPAVWYKPEGKALTERLWEETMEELNFARASSVISSLKGHV
ncbi:hypothetical protein LQW54_001554 [Pestalotiopsis sp. IQ-011]